ncbi:hypothetical protein CRM22_002552 [Opisthorchis felineus]|uniref:Uncharacterized protein n=1 Tax=Opisthorchis felineus TaxID=147828 RepID=A0A4S2MBI1_OPIFE|nr:hypothetical protein CRM22_002552 [Opisthorchis felineus]
MSCKQQERQTEFILKVSRFSELTHIPIFRPENPVYFLAQQSYCEKHGMRIVVKLSPGKNSENKTKAIGGWQALDSTCDCSHKCRK